MVSKKDFIAAAKRLRAALDGGLDRAALEMLARAECADYRRANPNFDESRFLRACGLI